MKARAAHMPIAAIRRDGGTQIRAALDESTVADYLAVLKAGGSLPPVGVMFDGQDHWLWDGFHRVEAELRNGAIRMNVDITKGTRRDAILAACGANVTHGLRRSNADKRRAVETLLADAEWREWPLRAIAKAAGVSHTFVSEVRDTVNTHRGEVVNVYKTEGGKAQGDEGAGNAGGAASIPASHKRPAPDEPPAGTYRCEECGYSQFVGTPCNCPARPSVEMDLLGIAAPDEPAGPGPAEEAWFAEQRARPRVEMDLLGIAVNDELLTHWAELEASLVAFDNHLKAAQASLVDWLGSPYVGADVQELRRAVHDIAARARKSVRPKSVCLYCKDPNGMQTGGAKSRRANCNGCRGRGWLSKDQLIAVPSELKGSDKVIDQQRGGFVAREQSGEIAGGLRAPQKARRVHIQDDAGRELVVDRDEDDAAGW